MGPLLQDITVNGEVIPAAAIAAEAQMHAAPKGKPGLAWRAAGRALAVRALLMQEAHRRGLRPEPRLTEDRAETDDEALIRALLDAAVAPDAPADESLRAVYAEDPARWRAPDLWEASHILFPVRPGDAEGLAAAKTAAAAALEELARLPAAFDRLAKDLSACPSREAGGRLGQIGPGDTVPEFEAALTRLAEGDIAPEPVATRFGLHIIRLDARAEGQPLPFEAARPAILAAMAKAGWARAARDFVTALAAKADITGVDLKAA